MGYISINWDKVEQDVMGTVDVNGGKNYSILVPCCHNEVCNMYFFSCQPKMGKLTKKMQV